MIASRRRFLLGAGALLTAPAIVRVASLMPVSVPRVLHVRPRDTTPYTGAEVFSVYYDESAEFIGDYKALFENRPPFLGGEIITSPDVPYMAGKEWVVAALSK